MNVKVWVDESTCIGSGTCARLAKTTFRLDEERGVAYVTDADVYDERRLTAAERACPTGAIHIDRI